MGIKDAQIVIYMFFVLVYSFTTAWAIIHNPIVAPFWMGLGLFFCAITTVYIDEKIDGAQYTMGAVSIAALSVLLLIAS